MLHLLKEKNRLNETIFMGVLSVLCFAFSIFRFLYSDTRTFLFLNWNLFLAFVPWFLSSFAIIKPQMQQYKLIIALLMFVWLLFFPNAPYILTDLFHLRLRASMPIWFDLVLILCFAWTGLLFGFLSLWDIEKVLKTRFSATFVSFISICLLFLGSFGIYVGRYLRWNSWDIIREPFGLLYDIGDRLISPIEHPRAWGMTLFMGIFLNMIYWSFRLIRKREE
jgi:uncharacterized membrane protein